MLRTINTLVLAASFAMGTPQGGSAQTYTCQTEMIPANESLYFNWPRLVGLATETTELAAAARAQSLVLNYPVTERNVAVVGTKRICSAAGVAVQAWIDGGPIAAPAQGGPQLAPPPDRTMWVVRIDRIRYVVRDRDLSLQAGEFDQLLVFDADWNFLEAFIW